MGHLLYPLPNHPRTGLLWGPTSVDVLGKFYCKQMRLSPLKIRLVSKSHEGIVHMKAQKERRKEWTCKYL